MKIVEIGQQNPSKNSWLSFAVHGVNIPQATQTLYANRTLPPSNGNIDRSQF